MGEVLRLDRNRPAADPKADALYVARRINEIRIRNNQTKGDLASALGLTVDYVTALEAARQNPSLSLLSHLAVALGCRLRDLVP